MSAAKLTQDQCMAIFEQLAAYAESCVNLLREATNSGEASEGTRALAEAAYANALILLSLADAAVIRCGGEPRNEAGPIAWLAGPVVAEALGTAPHGVRP